MRGRTFWKRWIGSPEEAASPYLGEEDLAASKPAATRQLQRPEWAAAQMPMPGEKVTSESELIRPAAFTEPRSCGWFGGSSESLKDFEDRGALLF